MPLVSRAVAVYVCLVTVTWQAIDAVLETSEGDMRKAITTLQSAARLKGKDDVTKADVVEVAGVICFMHVKVFCADTFYWLQGRRTRTMHVYKFTSVLAK